MSEPSSLKLELEEEDELDVCSDSLFVIEKFSFSNTRSVAVVSAILSRGDFEGRKTSVFVCVCLCCQVGWTCICVLVLIILTMRVDTVSTYSRDLLSGGEHQGIIGLGIISF